MKCIYPIVCQDNICTYNPALSVDLNSPIKTRKDAQSQAKMDTIHTTLSSIVPADTHVSYSHHLHTPHYLLSNVIHKYKSKKHTEQAKQTKKANLINVKNSAT